MLDYDKVKRFFADKIANDWLGHGRFESAMFHTAEFIHEMGRKDEAREYPNKLALSDAEQATLCNLLHKYADATHQESEEVRVARILIRRIEDE